MNKQKQLVLATVLALIAGTAVVLAHLGGNQRLGRPGLKTRPLAGSTNLEIILPEQVLDYSSEPLPEPQVVLDILPKDTSFGQRVYHTADEFQLVLNVVLMGADRTSLHKPQICLPAQGFEIRKTEVINVPITQPHSYDLPVIKLSVAKPVPGGEVPGLLLYWYVADGMLSADASALRRMWLSSKNLLLTGELQRWAYVTCFVTHPPGQEAACLERTTRFLAAAVPQFQTAVGTANPGGNSH